MVNTTWIILILGLFETVRVLMHGGVPFRGPILILSSIYPFYLISKMEIRTNHEPQSVETPE